MRKFYIPGGGLTLANQPVTLVFLNPPAAPKPAIDIRKCWVSQSGSVLSAMQRVEIVTQVTAFPTLVSVTPRPTNLADPNASIIVGGAAGAAGTCGINASAEGAGAKTILFDDVFNVLIGWQWTFEAGEMRLHAGLASGFGVYLPVAAATLGGWACGIAYEEV